MDVRSSFMSYLDQLKRSESDPSLGKGNSCNAMSCEGCSQKFTVFKRKKLCNICLRYFCTHCLTPQLSPNGSNTVLARLIDRRHICATCVVLTARPLCRLQLKRLKVKDLQHYLTAQRVSTHGCVEKDDLVNLLIRHVGTANNGSRNESICNSHSDLSTGNESNFSNPSFSRPPPPRDLPRTTINSTSNFTFSSPSQRPAQYSASVRTTVTSASTAAGTNPTTSNNSSSSSRNASSRPIPTPTGSEDGFEIVELTEDWSGDLNESGPEPVVEEISDSVAGTLSSPTSVGGASTLSSSTTSLGDPNVESTSTSSPSHELSPADGPEDVAPPPPAAPPPASSPPQPPPSVTVEEMESSEAGYSDDPVAENADHQPVRPPIITLNTIKCLEELQNMSVKQIKDLLMRNRVDFRGCCERTELVERATRLWLENKESKKALERMGSAEMCKICMDAPIECVMLECGHTATCMSCGKQLTECPLCRQFVVRVVRIFRA